MVESISNSFTQSANASATGSRCRDKYTNYAELIMRHMDTRADQPALIMPTQWNEHEIQSENIISYGELAQRIKQLRTGLQQQGFVAGDRVIVLFAVSKDLYALIIALMASGMVPVFIDIGMSLSRIRHSIQASRATAMVSCCAALRLRWLLPSLWRIPLYSIDSQGLGVKPFADLLNTHQVPHASSYIVNEPSGHALITFTSGSTGLPKAADRNHAMLIAQFDSLANTHTVHPGEYYSTCFPVFALYGLACGLTTVLPPVDFRRVGQVNGQLVLQQLHHYPIRYLAVGPAFLQQVVNALVKMPEQKLKLQTIVVGGAPVSRRLCQQVLDTLPDLPEAYVGYGSTEAEPIAHISMRDIIANNTIDGSVVGQVADDLQLKIVKLPVHNNNTVEEAIPTIDIAAFDCAYGEVGDIILRGDPVLPRYLDERDNARCKLFDTDGQQWHRIGDMGYFHPQNKQLVLVGRAGQAVTLNNLDRQAVNVHPLTLEIPLMDLPFVRFAALVTIPKVTGPDKTQAPLLAIELMADQQSSDSSQWVSAIKAICQQRSLHTPMIYRVEAMPVDGRHNSKIDRQQLAHCLQPGLSQQLLERLSKKRTKGRCVHCVYSGDHSYVA